MLKKIGIGLVVVLAVFLVVVAVQPEDFKFSRSTVIAAAPSQVFPHVNNFHHWEAWSPWAKLDPSMTKAYTGSESGEGAVYSWVGNDKVGEGKMTILKSQPTDSITIQLDFLKPMEATNAAEFTFKPEGEGTLVTWTMTGKKNFVAKAFHLLMDMDKLLGPDFERGLAQLKTVAESKKS